MNIYPYIKFSDVTLGLRSKLIFILRLLSLTGCYSVALLLPSCDAPNSHFAPPLEFHGPTMGTKYSVKILHLPTHMQVEDVDRAIAIVLQRLHDQMTTYDSTSEIARFSTYAGTDWFPVSADVCTIVTDAIRISQLSNGAFDITVAPLVNLWGFGPGLPRTKPPSTQEIAVAKSRVGYQHLHTRCDTKPALRKDLASITIDLSAIAQGYGADRVADLLEGFGIDNYMVDVGGELRGRGVNPAGKPWRIGIERPLPGIQGVVDRVINIKDAAVATSGTYRNFFIHEGVRYSHTIDPTTGNPITHNLVSVTIITKLAGDADALATTLAVLGPERGYDLALRHHLAAILIVYDGNKLLEKVTPFAAEYLTE